MLTARGAKRDKTSRFKLSRRLEILDDGKPIGLLECNLGGTEADFRVNDTEYTIATVEAAQHEPLVELLRQNAGKRPKFTGKPLVLKHADGHIVALAALVKASFIVARQGETFELRKASLFNPSYRVHRTGNDQPLGSVGQKSLFSRMLHMELPAEFDAAFCAYLLVLALNLAMQRAASSNNYN